MRRSRLFLRRFLDPFFIRQQLAKAHQCRIEMQWQHGRAGIQQQVALLRRDHVAVLVEGGNQGVVDRIGDAAVAKAAPVRLLEKIMLRNLFYICVVKNLVVILTLSIINPFGMELLQLTSILLFLFSIILAFLLFKKIQNNKLLKAKLENTMGLIEERLALSNNYSKTLASVADKTFEAVIITDKNGYIEWVNTGFTNITGYSFLEVKGKKPGEILQGPETDISTINRIREKLKENKIFKEEILNYHKQGHKYWLSLSITPVLDANNNIEKFIAIESDITLQKKEREILEQKLKEATERK